MMRYPKIFKFSSAIFLAALLFIPAIASAADETYAESIAHALANIKGVAASNAFVPDYPTRGNKAMFSIQGDPSQESSAYGLKYQSNYGDGKNYLIVRTLTNVGYYTSGSGALRNGTGDYTIFGSPSAAASWVTTGNDSTKFIDSNVTSAANILTTMEKGLGMSGAGTHTAVVEYGVLGNNNNLIRPTNLLDIKSFSTTNTDYTYHATFTPVQPLDMSSTVFNNVQTYLQSWQTTALGGAGTFPWTELGYTYYWGHSTTDLNAIQGLSEFIILGGTAVKIIGMYSPQSYFYTKNKNGAFSTDSDAEYGNGFGSFNVTGNCDTIWAGNAFQSNASTDASSPNQITISSSSTISGGQGILVWSPNYTVTNYGTIKNATDKKLKDATTGAVGMTGTENVALLFLGNTTYGDPGGTNILVNSGSISNSTTAASTGVEADAGNTDITNSGTISGFTYGIHLLSGTNTITNSGTISATGGAADSAAIQIDSGTTTLNNTGGTINGNIILANNTTAALDIGSTNLALTGKYVQNSASTLKIAANSSTDFGKVSATSAATSVNAGSKVNVTVSGYVPNNTVFSNVISATGSVGISVPTTITSSSPIFTFSGANGTGDHLDLTATRAQSYNSFATNANSSAVGVVLNSLATAGATGDMATVLGALDSQASSEEINQSLSILGPNADNSSVQVNRETQGKFISTSVDHLDSLFAASADSAGALDPAVWAQPFGTYLHQDPRGTSNGYNASVWGLLGGYDTQVNNNLFLGLSGGYARNEIRTKDASGHSGVDSYQFGLYSRLMGRACYLDSVFSFAYNRYDSSRKINFGGLDRTPTAKYSGQQYSAYFEGGYNLDYKKLEITPLVSLQYMRLNIDGYTEKNADAANLSVNRQGYNLLQSGLGVKAALTMEKKNYSLVPEIHFKWLYNCINENQQVTSTFTGGGASFATSGFNSPTSSYNFGTKFTILTRKNNSLTINYDCELKPDFYSHSGYLNLRHEF